MASANAVQVGRWSVGPHWPLLLYMITIVTVSQSRNFCHIVPQFHATSATCCCFLSMLLHSFLRMLSRVCEDCKICS